MNTWKVKIWLSQEQKEFSKWNKKTFFLVSQVLCFRHTKQTRKNIMDTTFKKVVTNRDLSKASGPYFMPVLVLRGSKPELSEILAELFNMCLKESCFPNCWKVPLVVLVFNNFGAILSNTTALLVLFLWLVKSVKNF